MESTSLLGNRNTNEEDKSSTVTGSVFSGVGSLIKFLPTATIFLFRFLNPIATNSGHCGPANKYISAALLAICAFNCCFATFTDSYTGSDGRRHYAIATPTGLWPAPLAENVELWGQRARVEDIVHALFSLGVFGVVGLLDLNTVRCLYPELEAYQEVLLKVLPPVMGVVSGVVFSVFPWKKRHGIGYPLTTDDASQRHTPS